MGLFDWLIKPNIDKLQANRDLAGLSRAVHHRNRFVRHKAVIALGQVFPVEALGVLLEALRDVDGWVREKAISVVARINDARVVGPLFSIQETASNEMRCEIARTLVKLGDPRGFDILDDIKLKNDSISIQVDRLSLVQLLRDRAKEELSDKGPRDQSHRALDEAHVARLVGVATKHPVLTVRSAALDLLVWLGDMRALEPLISALDSQDASCRMCIMEALGRLGDRRAVEPLLSALRSRPVGVVELWTGLQALDRLGELGPSHDVRPLLAFLEDCVANSSALGIGQYGDVARKSVMAHLADIVLDSKNPLLVATAAIAAARLGADGQKTIDEWARGVRESTPPG